MTELRIQIPQKLTRIMKPARIKVMYGGRGGGKTASLSRIVMAKMLANKTKVLALREFMNSIGDSVHSTVRGVIDEMQMTAHFKVLNNEITCANGSELIYGQMARNIESIKSKDAVDIAWVEEAETVSERSIEVLEPSIRAAGSEIWYSLNPKDEDGAVYSRYIKPYLDQIDKYGFYESDEFGGLIVVKINLEDNPFAPQELIDDSARMKRENPRKWLHVYGGEILLEDGDDNLISPDIAVFATKTNTCEKSGAKIIGVDPARFGKDKTAIIRREGRVAYALAKLDQQDTMQVAGRIALIIKIENPDKVFIDVGGLGAGIVDRLNEMGYGEIIKGVNFGGKATQNDRYFNKRAEMWGNMKDWLEDVPVSIPDDAGLIRDLTTVKYKLRSDGTMQLESKDEMKKRLGRSTDSGDALALTFAFPVRKELRAVENFYQEASYVKGDTLGGY